MNNADSGKKNTAQSTITIIKAKTKRVEWLTAVSP
jgi:hypothetical protein